MRNEKIEKLVALAELLPESEKEKLNCVVQGMLLAQNTGRAVGTATERKLAESRTTEGQQVIRTA